MANYINFGEVDPLKDDWIRLQRTLQWLQGVQPQSRQLFYLERSAASHNLTKTGFRQVFRAWQTEQAQGLENGLGTVASTSTQEVGA